MTFHFALSAPPPPPPAQHNGSVGIQLTSMAVIANPAPIWLEAVNLAGFDVGGPSGGVYDPSFHEITFIWTVRDAPLGQYVAPQNMVTDWNNANNAYGKKVAFAFPDPGTYTIDLWAVDKLGTTAVAERTFTVLDADTVYPGDQTICYSNDGNEDWIGEKPGCQRITSDVALQAVLDGTSLPTRTLFKRGQVMPSFYILSDSNSYLTHVDTWGSGAKPEIQVDPNGSQGTFWYRNGNIDDQITFANLKFKGLWDSTTETGIGEIRPVNWSQKDVDFTSIFWNVEVDGYNSHDPSPAIGIAMNHMFANSSATNWRSFGLFMQQNQTGRLAVIGSALAHHVDALNGGPKHRIGNDHGPTRIAHCGNVYFAVTDFFSNAGWSRDVHDTQACIRANTSTQLGASYIMDRIACENGNLIIDMEAVSEGANDNPGNFLIDQALLIGTSRTYTFIGAQFGGTTVRNLLGFMPDTPDFALNQVMFRFGSTVPVNNNLDEPVAMHNVTGVTLRAAANELGPGVMEFVDQYNTPFNNFTEENNAYYAPNASVSDVSRGPIDLVTAIPGIQPRYKGLRHGYAATDGTLSSTANNASLDVIPYSLLTRVDEIGNGSTDATDQGYWLATIAAGDVKHAISINNAAEKYWAELGHFTVTATSTGLLVTNTSGETWPGGVYAIKFDRKSMLDAELPLDTSYASPAFIPTCRPLATSNIIAGATSGLIAYGDAFGAVRPSPAADGYLEPAT